MFFSFLIIEKLPPILSQACKGACERKPGEGRFKNLPEKIQTYRGYSASSSAAAFANMAGGLLRLEQKKTHPVSQDELEL
jgi:hypothetical protein